MTRLITDPNLPVLGSANYDDNLRWKLDKLLRDFSQQVNQLTEGRINAITNADTAAPTTQQHAQGDKVWNSTPAEAGSSNDKYVIIGWICTVSGTPGTWLEIRTLTGN